MTEEVRQLIKEHAELKEEAVRKKHIMNTQSPQLHGFSCTLRRLRGEKVREEITRIFIQKRPI